MVVSPVVLAAVATLTACQDPSPTAVEQTAPLSSQVEDALAGQWIVVFEDGVADAPGLARRLVAAHGGTLRFTYEHALRGFAASLSDTAVQALRSNPNVAYVEADQRVWALGSQSGATWGLDRIDQRGKRRERHVLGPHAGSRGSRGNRAPGGIHCLRGLRAWWRPT